MSVVTKVLPALNSAVRGRNALLLFDTACTALASMVLVVAAARSLGTSPQLAGFSLAQLSLVTLIGLVRTALWGPAMAAQRTTGKAKLPLSWVPMVGVPAAVVSALLMTLLIPVHNTSRTAWFFTLFAAAAVLLFQDGLRSVLMSRDASIGALWSDAAALVIITLAMLTGWVPHTAAGIIAFWTAAMGVALVLALFFLSRHPAPHLEAQSLVETWRIGRWGTVDATLSSFATLLPMFASTLVVGSSLAGPYRTLQTAMGPLNILHTTVVTAFGLDAWQAATRDGVRTMQRKANRLAWMLLLLAVTYIGIGIPAMAYVSKLHDPDLWRVGILVGLAALMGAVNTPYNAASLALGYQRFGAIIRMFVVVVSIALSIPWTVRNLVPWHDPIGINMVATSAITFIGWLVSYRLAIRAEMRRPRRAALEDGALT